MDSLQRFLNSWRTLFVTSREQFDTSSSLLTDASSWLRCLYSASASSRRRLRSSFATSSAPSFVCSKPRSLSTMTRRSLSSMTSCSAAFAFAFQLSSSAWQ